MLYALILAALWPQTPPASPPAAPPAVQAGAPPATEPARDTPPPYSETVVVTATRVSEPLVDVPVSMTVVGAEQIATTPAAQVGELLQGVPGLNVVQLSAREFAVAGRQPASVLGTGQLVLIDGRVANNGNSGMFWDQLPIGLDEIEQVEILHGPASVVWGANAMSAVINLRTKTPREMKGLQITGGGGERGLGLGAIRWADERGKVSYKVSGSYLREAGWDRPTTLADGSPITGLLAYTNPDLRQPKVDFRLDYESTKDHVWSFRGGYGATSGMLFNNDLPLELTRTFYSSYADMSYTAPSLDARVSWGRAGGPFRNLADRSINQSSSTYPTAELNYHRALNTHHLVALGASTRFDFWDIAVVPKRSSRHSAGAYVEDQIFVNQTLRFTVGGRIDAVQLSGTAFSPRAGVLVQPAPKQSLRFSVSRGFRIPSPVESFVDISSGYNVDLAPGLSQTLPLQIVGNGDLKAVRSLGFEGGYTGVVAGRHTLQATLYRTIATDNIQTGATTFYGPADPPPDWPFPASTVPAFALPKVISYVNTGEVRNDGVELGLNSTWTKGIWTAFGYTYQRKPVVSKADPAFPILVNEPPAHQASGAIGWRRAAWNGSLNVIHTDRAFWTDVLASDPRIRGYSDAYTLVNVSVSYAIPRRPIELIVKATNLFDQSIQQHVFGDVIRRQVSCYVRLTLPK
jgi:outer membrane receptor protein involved in Fe transport